MENRITVTGIIVSVKPETRNGAAGTITVAVKTAYRVITDGHGGNAVRDDYLVFEYNDKTKTKDIAKTFAKNDHVYIIGHAASYMKGERGKTSKECCNLYIDTISPTRTEYKRSFGKDGGHYPQDFCSFCVEGIVETITLQGEGAILRLNASEDGRGNFLNFIAYGKYADTVRNLNPGDTVCICARIRTLPFNKPTKSRDFHQFRITAIDKK